MRMRQHYNVIIGDTGRESVAAMEVLITAALNTFLPPHLKQTVEVCYAETFDADAEAAQRFGVAEAKQ